MKRKKSIILAVALAVFMASCGDHKCEEGKPCDNEKEGTSCKHKHDDTDNDADNDNMDDNDSQKETMEESNSKVVLELNDGKKWNANEETHIGMEKMQELLKAFADSEENNYMKLGEDLSAQTTYIIQNCDMTGPDHDMLHKVLHPILETIESISEADNAENDVKELDYLLKTYFEYFD